MSRGHGRWQRLILERLTEPGRLLVGLWAKTRAESVAVRRAAQALASTGKVELVRLPDSRNVIRLHAALPGAKHPDGRLYRDLSVAHVPPGTPATLTWTCRQVAAKLNISKSQAHRDIQKADLLTDR
jgi:hypothetical protein